MTCTFLGNRDTHDSVSKTLELIPPKFAILQRNRWMIDHAECVITCIHHGGGAETARNYARLKDRKLIEI